MGTADASNDKEKKIAHFSIPANERVKRCGMDFYETTLGSPKYVVAPMVDQSELAWRLLSRRHGAELCYTPMYHSNVFIQDLKYREFALQSCPEDRPLIIQFCGNDPKILLEAALIAQDHCDAIDINLGCPQAIAKRGHYGSFLQEEWELLQEIVSTLHKNLAVPVTCKIRRFDEMEKTIKYAQMLVNAGCQMLTVHGRTREQKGPLTGIADWNYIKAVRENVSVPVLANGNILSIEDIDDCMRETRVVGVMTAEGNLHNPALFERNVVPLTWKLSHEYLDLVEEHPCPRGYIRGHIFKICHHLLGLKENNEIREEVASAQSVKQFRHCIDILKTKFEPFHNGEKVWYGETEPTDFNLSLPPWICQPYIRMEPEKHIERMAEKQRIANDPTREKTEYFDDDGQKISKKLMKKLMRKSRRSNTDQIRKTEPRIMELCLRNADCNNPMGVKCDHKLCRVCCRDKCYTDELICTGHKFRIERRNRKHHKGHSNADENDEPTSLKIGAN